MTRSADLSYEEPPAVNRKKALLRLLAVGEAERLGVDADADELADFERSFRAAYGLDTDEALAVWLASTALTQGRFAGLMRELLLQTKVELHHAAAIDRAAPEQRALWTAHRWASERAQE